MGPSPCLQYGAEPGAFELLNTIRFDRLQELEMLLAAAEAAAEGGQALDPGEATTLLQRSVAWSKTDCLEVGGESVVDGTATAAEPCCSCLQCIVQQRHPSMTCDPPTTATLI